MTPRTLPTTAELLGPFAAAAGILVLAGTLSGCSAIVDALHKVHQEQFANYAAAEDGWAGVALPAWVPADATNLRNYATTDETQAVVGVTTPSTPIGCVPGARTTMPFELPEWAPAALLENEDGTLIEEVLLCGDYQVAPVDGGWVGWFAAREAGQTPQP